jgi:hypothetical protein
MQYQKVQNNYQIADEYTQNHTISQVNKKTMEIKQTKH